MKPLKEMIPRGRDDDKNGLNYMPIMLQNIEMRRNRYRESSSWYLRLTIAFCAVFATVVVFFAYILTNDSATGLPRAIDKLATAVDVASRESKALSLAYINSPSFNVAAGSSFERLEKFLPDGDQREKHAKLIESLSGMRSTGDFAALLSMVQTSRRELAVGSPSTANKVEFRNLLDKIEETLRRLVLERSGLPLRYQESIAEARIVSDALSKYAASPEAKNLDLWKRLGLGAIICTFFFVVLRYFSSIYREHHAQALLAERDDLAMRQFIIAFRGAGDDIESKRAALSALMSNSAQKLGGSSDKQDGADDAGLIKDLIGALSKRL